MTLLFMAARPCPTCPYSRDTPTGVWAPEEYEKLATYDDGTAPPKLGVFHCHQENATGRSTVCRGWLVVHRDCVAVRLAILRGLLTIEQRDQPCDVALYSSGWEACVAGLAGVPAPSAAARAAMVRLLSRGAACTDPL